MLVKEILAFLESTDNKYSFRGNTNLEIDGYCSLTSVSNNKITWIKKLEDNKDYSFLNGTNVVVINSSQGLSNDINLIITDTPKKVFFDILNTLFEKKEKRAISSESVILTKRIGNNVSIGPNCFIDKDVEIGDDVTISSNVVLKNKVRIGNRVSIQSLTTIGEDGFGYFETEDGVKTMVKHHGGVIIEDDVFISTHVNIARGTLDDTIIRSGTKIAPSSHIGHNCIVGHNVTIICSELFGSVVVGDNSYISKATIKNQIKIGKNVIVGMGSVVLKDVPDNVVVVGIPAKFLRNN